MIRLPNNFRREFIQLVIIKIKFFFSKHWSCESDVANHKLPPSTSCEIYCICSIIDASSLLGNNNHNNPMFIVVKNVAVVIENKSHIFVSQKKEKSNR